MTRPRYTLGHHVLLEALFILLYAVPRLRKLRFILLLLPIAYIFFFMRLPDATPYPYFDMALGNRFGTILLLSSADFLLLRRDPQEEYRSTEDKRDISRLPFHKRLWWALQVWGNPRGVGWTHQVQSGLPSRPTETSRSRFILKLGREVLTSLILYDINKAFLRRNPFFDPRTVDSIASFNGLWGHRGLWRIHAAIGYSFNLRLEMNHTHKIVALGCLLAGFTQPQDWPDLFGPLSDTYTLGGFWGKAWHAMHKRALVAHAKALNNLLGFTQSPAIKPPRSKSTKAHPSKPVPQPALAALTGLVLIFTITATMHLLGDYAMLGSGPCIAYPPSSDSPAPSSNTSVVSFGPFLFFIYQIPGLIFEKTMINIAHRFSLVDGNPHSSARRRWKLLGYVWVYGWCALTLPGWISPHIQHGCWEKTLEIYGPLMMGWKGLTGQ